ncbi:MAG: hypothetical protein ABJC04_07235 [Verrucomicrobiota bacterium]
MKTLVCFLTVASIFTLHFDAQAQARKLTRRIVNPDNTLRTPNNPAPAVPAPVSSVAVPPPRPAQAVTNAVPVKTKEQMEEALKKTVEFQKQRANAGAPTAQYDLGMRYLTGDGVEKNLDLAKKWLNASATNGNSQAAKKLDELKKKESK